MAINNTFQRINNTSFLIVHSISFRSGTKNSGKANALNNKIPAVITPPLMENDKTSFILMESRSKGFTKNRMNVTKIPHDKPMPALINLFCKRG